MLDKEFQYYLDHQAAIVKKYKNKYIVIVDENIIGAYNSEREAFDNTVVDHEPGTFLIQFCTSGENSYTEVFHSRVVI